MNARHLDGDEPQPRRWSAAGALRGEAAAWRPVSGPIEWGDPPRDTVLAPGWSLTRHGTGGVLTVTNPEPQRTHPFVAGLLFGAGLTVALCLAGLAAVALATGLGVW